MSSSMLINREPNTTSAGKYKIRAAVAALIAAAALSGCAVFPRSTNPSVDQKITADVKASFRQHAELEPPNSLTVQTINGVVYLHGLVSTNLQRADAESVAGEVRGVRKVVNSIAVDNG
jgi:hypothetical protein